MNTFNDDNELGFFEEPRRRPPRDRGRRPQRSAPRRQRPPDGPNHVLRLAGLVAIAIAVVVGFVLLVGSCGGPSKDEYTSYFSAMKPLAQDSAKVGAEFTTALSTPGLTLDTFKSDLASWSAREKADYLAAQRLRPPGPIQSVHAEALAAFQLRYTSLDHLAITLTTLEQSKHVSGAIAAAALAGDAQLLTASDVVWEQLYKLQATTVLTTQGVRGVIVPGSTIVTSPDIVSPSSLRTLYQRVGTRSTGGHVTGRHGSNLIGTNAVENGVSTPLSTSTATTVGSSAEIDVVFSNSGSYVEVQVPVTLTVKVSGNSVYTATVKVPQIAVGAQATASFTNLQLPTSSFGPSASITVSIGKVPGEVKLDNNEATYPVFFQLSSN